MKFLNIIECDEQFLKKKIDCNTKKLQIEI